MTTAEPNPQKPAPPQQDTFQGKTQQNLTQSIADFKTSPSLTDTVVIKRRDRRSVHAQVHLDKLPKVPESLAGRVLCAHPEIVTASVSLCLALVFILPREFLTVATGVGVLIFAFGWGRLIRLPAPKTSMILISLVGLAVVVTARVFGDFSIIAELVGLGVVGAFVAEMWRQPRLELISSVSGNVAGVLIASTSGAWIVLENETLWYFLLVPAAITLLGGCVGMAMSANWTTKSRAITALVMSSLFGFVAGAAIMGLYGSMREQLIIFAGGHLPTLPAAVVSGVILGAVVGLTFSALTVVFSDEMSPVTVDAAFSQALIPVLAAGIPIYILARLLVGDGPSIS